MDVRLGWRVARSVYFAAGYDGVLNEVSAMGTYSRQLNASLFSLGFRAYPFDEGLILGVDAGVSELDDFVLWGYGFGGTIAWDFSEIGLNAELGARALFLLFDYNNPSYMLAVMPFVAIVLR